jgi:hypothetical protein
MKLFPTLQNQIGSLNSSRFFAGIIMLMLNLGSKYVSVNLSKTQEEFLKASLARELLIFSIVWMGTRDIYISLILTACFIILADYLFNEKSNLCVMPKTFKKIEKNMDLNNDGIVSEEELMKAEAVLEKAKKQETNQVQTTLINNMTAI